MYTNININNLDTNDNHISKLLSNSWSNRVAVKTSNLDIANYYDINIPDYPPGLVPFVEDSRYQNLKESTRKKILAGAWISYNEKTINIEVSIVAPVCAFLLKGEFPGVNTDTLKRVIAQTQIDEQFHILMCLDACLITRKLHNLEELVIPESLVVIKLQQAIEEEKRPRDKMIVQLAFACVAEVTINAYLDLLANDKEIQPFNKETTNLHRKDEAAHHKIFKDIAKNVFTDLNTLEKKVFIKGLAKGLNAFTTIDFTAWREILLFLNIDAANDIVDQCLQTMENKRVVRDYSGIRGILKELCVSENELDFDFDFDEK